MLENFASNAIAVITPFVIEDGLPCPMTRGHLNYLFSLAASLPTTTTVPINGDIPNNPQDPPVQNPNDGDTYIRKYNDGFCISCFNGNVWQTRCYEQGDDTDSDAVPAPAAGTDSFGRDYLAGESIIELDNGDIVAVVNKFDLTQSVLNAAGIPDSQYGLSAGQLALPFDSPGVTSPVATLWNSPKATAYSVSPRSVVSGLYNSAVEGVAGTVGIRNTDGSFGHYSKIVTTVEELFNNTGACLITTVTPGVPINIPAPTFDGQIANIKFEDSALRDEMFVVGNTSGVSRNGLNEIISHSDPILVRPGESLVLIGSGAGWIVKHDYTLWFGVGWRENTNGLSTLYFNASIGLVPDVVVQVPLPVTITNPQSIRAAAVDFGSNNINAGIAAANFGVMPSLSTTTSLAAIYRLSSNNNPLDTVGNVQWQIENVRIDKTTI